MDTVLLALLSLILGGIIGFFTFQYFYKKTEVFEQDMRYIVDHIRQIYMNTKYPTLFQPQSFVQKYSNQRPVDPDNPHLEEVRCETNVVPSGGTLFVLFHMVDEGRNLSLTQGVEVRNNLNLYCVPITQEGFGWLSCAAKIPEDAPAGTHRLVFSFKDAIGKSNTQDFNYIVSQ